MPVQPYDNCPCGSGKKFKWCCQKVAKYAERAEQMLEKGQVAGALQAIDEGLAVEPQNPWLRIMKVQVLLSTHDHDAAKPLIQDILASQPGHRPVLLLRLQDELAHAAVEDAVATLQEIVDATAPDEIEESLAWMVFVGRALAEIGLPFPALAHLRIASAHESLQSEAESAMASLERNSEASPWLRDTWELRPAPSGVVGERWANAIALAAKGRWQRAASIFEAITAEQPESAAAWFNLGLCQGWLAVSDGAGSLERYAQLEPDSESAVDALALAQSLDPRESTQTVDVIQIRYSIRDHSRLIQRLKDHPRFQVHMLDARRDELGEGVKDEFYLLNKDSVSDPDAMTLESLPAIVGVVRTRGKELELEFAEPAVDDPRPGITVGAAADTIDPDGKRSVAGTIPLSTYRLRRMWGIPAGWPLPAVRRIRQLVHQQNYHEVWPDTPLGWLGNRTPREAAQLPELKPVLRAAVMLNEYACEVPMFDIDMDALRSRLGLHPEPWLDGDKLDIERLPLARLRRVRVESLSVPQLRLMFERASRFSLPLATERSAAELVTRPAEREQFDPTFAFYSLIELAKRRADRAAAARWLAQARRFDVETNAAAERPTWDIAEWEISLQFDSIQEWGPRLVQLVKKLESNKEAAQELTLVLVRAGIIRLAPHPSDPNRMMMDARILEQILARFAAPQGSMLDLSPVGGQPGKIWTPADQIPGGDSSIVLPGQESAAKPRSKLVIPGS